MNGMMSGNQPIGVPAPINAATGLKLVQTLAGMRVKQISTMSMGLNRFLNVGWATFLNRHGSVMNYKDVLHRITTLPIFKIRRSLINMVYKFYTSKQNLV